LDKVNYYKDLLTELTKKEIKVRYKNSYLGYLWSLANPLFLALIFYFVFKIVTKVQMKDYTLFLISGLFVWQWISNAIIASANLYIANASLIKKVNFPRNFLVIALVLSEGFNFLMSIPVILIFMFYYHKFPTSYWFLIPILLIITGIFIYSISLLIATINLFFRDMERLIGLLMTFLFYLTPIIYPLSMVPIKYHTLLYQFQND
jgi:lipopolysaccharide transport system permease protein